jgi:uncharacterized SAM-dependent methyltransferase
MTTCPGTLNFESVVARSTREEFISEVRRSLTTRLRSLASWMFYDGYGSRLFERITTLPQYYPTCTEGDILARDAHAIVATILARTSQPLRILEVGAGLASKTGLLLEASVREQAEVLYMLVDVFIGRAHRRMQKHRIHVARGPRRASRPEFTSCNRPNSNRLTARP